MRSAIIFSLAACAAFATMAVTSVSLGGPDYVETATPTVFQVSNVEGLSADALPPEGRCRIVYDQLPEHRQPAHMECEHAVWLAQSWGGRVIANAPDGAFELARYEGRNDFTGVPEHALPPYGYCRAWLDDTTVEAQPAASDCRVARRIAETEGGRVLFMPL